MDMTTFRLQPRATGGAPPRGWRYGPASVPPTVPPGNADDHLPGGGASAVVAGASARTPEHSRRPDARLGWRARHSGEWLDGSDVPLAEESERYRRRGAERRWHGGAQLCGAYHACRDLQRRPAGPDFGSAQAAIAIRVYQLSAVLGRVRGARALIDTTANLALPLLAQGQAQKEVWHNKALAILDALVECLVNDKDLAVPPGAPAEGDRWMVAASPTGARAGRAAQIALWRDGA